MIPIPKNVARQPKNCPTTRPRGSPNTVAKAVPVANNPRAWAFLPAGATRIAKDAVIDQNTAWDNATPIRPAIRISKLHANPEIMWLITKITNKKANNLRRSILLVNSIKGNDIKATTHA